MDVDFLVRSKRQKNAIFFLKNWLTDEDTFHCGAGVCDWNESYGCCVSLVWFSGNRNAKLCHDTDKDHAKHLLV